MEIAVLGATGTFGRLVTAQLESAGHTVRPISRSAGVDVQSRPDVQRALTGADVAVDCLNIETMRTGKAVSFFTQTAGNVVAAAESSGLQRIVCLSIAGAADPAVNKRFGYYRGKAAQEAVYRGAAVPVTIIHSTQWFELIDQIVRRAGLGPIAVLPKMTMAAVAADRVAALACREVQFDGDAERTVAIRGPQTATTAELVRTIQSARGDIGGRRLRVITELPFLGAGIAGGGLIPAEAIVDDMTLQQWLAHDEGGAGQ